MTELPSYRAPDFTVETTEQNGTLRARLHGNADLDAIAPLGSVLKALHAELVRRHATEIEVDWCDLEFMNSACLKLFVGWVSEILDAPEEQRYKLRFRSNPETRWQRRSLVALQCFTTDYVALD